VPGGPPAASDRGSGRPAEDSPSLVAGKVGKPHGLDGSFHVVDPVPGALDVGADVGIGKIVARKGTEAAPILRLDVAADRTAIEALRGAELRVPRSAARALEDDEYWADDLAGCSVFAGERDLGTVERMVAYPSCEVLVVGEHLIPMVRDAIRSVDVAARRIEVDPDFLGL
jgi:16S rRNA processing protein RimM